MVRTILFASVLALGVGCNDQGPEVARQKVPRIESKKPVGEKDRMLALLVTEKDATWSFRLSGPETAVTALEKPFDAFVKSIKFGDKPPVKWTLPDGWKEEPGDQVRFATIKTGPQPKPLEVTVVELPKEGGAILPNVNRWRGQLTLPPLDADELAEVTKAIDVDGRKGTLVDLVGKFGAKGKMPPMAPKDVPPPPPKGDSKKLTYDVPQGWAKVKPKNAMIQEQFDIVDAGKKAEATIVVLPGGAGGVFGNLQRWRGQIKLPPAKDEELVESLVKLELPAGKAIFTDIDNPKADGDNRILGVILPTASGTYFLKLMGPSELVGRERTKFEAFAKSLKFEP